MNSARVHCWSCPLRVISGHTDKSAPCPLYPPSRRWLNALFSIVLDTVDGAVDRVGLHQSRIIRLEHALKLSTLVVGEALYSPFSAITLLASSKFGRR